MPKGKKKFIDRKNAVSFHLVHRSQQDPLISNEDAPQHVLLPSVGKSSKVDEQSRKAEQRKWGITWDDDYNYLQHLRTTSEGSECELVRFRIMAAEPTTTDPHPQDVSKSVKLMLPSSVFASTIEEDVGVLNLAAPHPGPQLDLDPDIVAAMDEDFDYDDPDNILDDDFVQLANTRNDNGDDQNDLDNIVEEEEISSDESMSSDGISNDDIASLKGSQFTFMDEETKSRFTNYSVSSSVIKRNDQLTLLDNRFEKMFAGYDDSEIGALDCEEIQGYIPPDSDVMLHYAEEFQREQALHKHETDTSLKDLDVAVSSEEENEMTYLEVQDRKDDRLDCESILSTYSNIYNHPKLITEPMVPKRIRVSARTGIPIGVLDNGAKGKLTARALAKLDAQSLGAAVDKDGTESIRSTLSVLSIRPKHETPEKRLERKKALKEYRKERRLEKKANTLAFKEEKKRQEKNMLNAKVNSQTVRIA